MLRIALIGAPTAGKTELAQQIQESLSNQKVVSVDNYISEIEKRSDNTLGHFASYIGNIQATIGRWEAERRVIRDESPDVLVTCGTPVESTVYNAVQALLQHQSESGTLTMRALQNDRRASLSMTMLGMIAFDVWEYDYSFYLPLGEDADNDAKIVDKSIVECAEALNVPFTTLPANHDLRVAEVLKEVVPIEVAE